MWEGKRNWSEKMMFVSTCCVLCYTRILPKLVEQRANNTAVTARLEVTVLLQTQLYEGNKLITGAELNTAASFQNREHIFYTETAK